MAVFDDTFRVADNAPHKHVSGNRSTYHRTIVHGIVTSVTAPYNASYVFSSAERRVHHAAVPNRRVGIIELVLVVQSTDDGTQITIIVHITQISLIRGSNGRRIEREVLHGATRSHNRNETGKLRVTRTFEIGDGFTVANDTTGKRMFVRSELRPCADIIFKINIRCDIAPQVILAAGHQFRPFIKTIQAGHGKEAIRSDRATFLSIKSCLRYGDSIHYIPREINRAGFSYCSRFAFFIYQRQCKAFSHIRGSQYEVITFALYTSLSLSGLIQIDCL